MSVGTILLIVLILLVIGAFPGTGLVSWGYGPSGVLGVLLIAVVVLLLVGRL